MFLRVYLAQTLLFAATRWPLKDVSYSPQSWPSGKAIFPGELEITDGSLFEFLDLCMANVRYLDDMPGQGWAEFRRRLIALWRSYNPISLAAPKVRHH